MLGRRGPLVDHCWPEESDLIDCGSNQTTGEEERKELSSDRDVLQMLRRQSRNASKDRITQMTWSSELRMEKSDFSGGAIGSTHEAANSLVEGPGSVPRAKPTCAATGFAKEAAVWA